MTSRLTCWTYCVRLEISVNIVSAIDINSIMFPRDSNSILPLYNRRTPLISTVLDRESAGTCVKS